MQFAHLDFNIEKSNSVDLGNSFGNFSVILEAHVRGCCFFFVLKHWTVDTLTSAVQPIRDHWSPFHVNMLMVTVDGGARESHVR